MRKIFVFASALATGLLLSCGTTEITNPTLAAEVGTASVSGKFRVNSDETNLSNGNTVYESFPSGVTLEVTYSQSDVNPLATTSSSINLPKVMQVSVAADGSYSFTVPASGRGTSITVTPLKFVTDYKYSTGGTTTETKKYTFSASSFNLTVYKGSSYPQSIKEYSPNSPAE
jgi:hypothetical protein